MPKKNRPRHLAGKDQKRRPVPSSAPRTADFAEATAQEREQQPTRPAAVPPPYVPRTTQARVPSRGTRATAQTIQLTTEYVGADLRRIGITAAGMFVILGVLAVFLH